MVFGKAANEPHSVYWDLLDCQEKTGAVSPLGKVVERDDSGVLRKKWSHRAESNRRHPHYE